MTLQQVCKKFNYSESYVSKNFPKVQKNILNKWGIVIQKVGRGKNATYQIIQDNSRALTLYKQDEARTVMLSKDSINQIVNMDFITFIGIIMTPLQVFRGSYKDFLVYIQMKNTQQNKENLKKSLVYLSQHDYIHYSVDKTDPEYFFAGIYRQVEKEIAVGINMIKVCKQLAAQHHKRSWVPMLKVWLGIKYLYMQDLQPYTIKDLSDLTGLSPYQIRQNGRILEQDNAFVSDKVYVSYNRCVGKFVQLNDIHEGNQL